MINTYNTQNLLNTQKDSICFVTWFNSVDPDTSQKYFSTSKVFQRKMYHKICLTPYRTEIKKLHNYL